MIAPKQIEKLNGQLNELRQILEKKYHLTEGRILESGTPAHRRFFSDDQYHKKEEKFLDFYSALESRCPHSAELKKIFEAYQELSDRIDQRGYLDSDPVPDPKPVNEPNAPANEEQEDPPITEPSSLEILTAFGEDDDLEDI